MTVSFIITTYNIEKYIELCLDTVRRVAKAGDQIILVDDGSTDETVTIVENFFRDSSFPDDVTLTPIFLGQNTMGGVGVAGNIGIDHAICETLFFVDGDDWLDDDGFNFARERFEASTCDIMFANYEEYDEKNKKFKKPADEGRWDALCSSKDFSDLQIQALSFIAVPWRKFYSMDFVRSNKLRFPEGHFFFEDNPFHWSACLHSTSIDFVNEVVCYHRINRPGQTMASTGVELIAFIDHYEMIVQMISDFPDKFRLQALKWLLANMSWHFARLEPKVAPSYLKKAELALKAVPCEIWSHPDIQNMSSTEIFLYASFLRAEGWETAFNYFLHISNRKDIKSIIVRLVSTENKVNDVRRNLADFKRQGMAHLKPIRAHTTALANASYFDAFLDNAKD